MYQDMEMGQKKSPGAFRCTGCFGMGWCSHTRALDALPSGQTSTTLQTPDRLQAMLLTLYRCITAWFYQNWWFITYIDYYCLVVPGWFPRRAKVAMLAPEISSHVSKALGRVRRPSSVPYLGGGVGGSDGTLLSEFRQGIPWSWFEIVKLVIPDIQGLDKSIHFHRE
jgi:hypothetical protein